VNRGASTLAIAQEGSVSKSWPSKEQSIVLANSCSLQVGLEPRKGGQGFCGEGC
jgi:hypothetical protein